MTDLFDQIKTRKILVIGDVMLDRYWWGDVTRISPEAPVPVVRHRETTNSLGGAANVAVNIAGLGTGALIVGCVGSDAEGEDLHVLLKENGIVSDHLINSTIRPTTVKTRVMAHGQQVARIDKEVTEAISGDDKEVLKETVFELIAEVDAVVVSDYAKGIVTDEIFKIVADRCRELERPLMVDPKSRDFSMYAGATLITPNRKEAAEACGMSEAETDLVEKAGSQLLAQLGGRAVLITEGENGMTLFQIDRPSYHIPTAARTVYDVTGAGDTVIATLASAIAAGLDMETASRVANMAAGIVVEKVGTTKITLDELRQAWEAESRSHASKV